MKIFLYIPETLMQVNIHRQLVSTLHQMLQQSAEVFLANKLAETEQLSQCDIVHIFGCKNKSCAELLSTAQQQGIPTVVSPLGELEPWNLKQEGLQQLKPQAYLSAMMRQASAVVVGGKLELKTFSDLKWNHHTVVIQNCILTSAITAEEMSQKLLQLYRKVMDTHAHTKIDSDMLQRLRWPMLAAINDDVMAESGTRNKAQELFHDLTDEQWRRLTIYAHEENILSLLRQGLQRLNIPSPDIDVENITRFTLSRKINATPLSSEKLTSGNIVLKSKLDDYKEAYQQKEHAFCTMLLNLRHEIRQNTVSVNHLIQSYQALRYSDFDEDKLCEIFKVLSIDDFAARIFAIQQQFLGLTEGFMPLLPIADKETQRLSTIIFNNNTSIVQ